MMFKNGYENFFIDNSMGNGKKNKNYYGNSKNWHFRIFEFFRPKNLKSKPKLAFLRSHKEMSIISNKTIKFIH